MLLVFGSTIFIGCATANIWERTVEPPWRWWAVLATKLVQITVMLYLAARLRPVKGPAMTAAERQILSLGPGYYAGFLTLLLINAFLDKPIPLAPRATVMSGSGFPNLEATTSRRFFPP